MCLILTAFQNQAALKSYFSNPDVLLSTWGISCYQTHRLKPLKLQGALKCISMENICICVFQVGASVCTPLVKLYGTVKF